MMWSGDPLQAPPLTPRMREAINARPLTSGMKGTRQLPAGPFVRRLQEVADVEAYHEELGTDDSLPLISSRSQLSTRLW